MTRPDARWQIIVPASRSSLARLPPSLAPLPIQCRRIHHFGSSRSCRVASCLACLLACKSQLFVGGGGAEATRATFCNWPQPREIVIIAPLGKLARQAASPAWRSRRDQSRLSVRNRALRSLQCLFALVNCNRLLQASERASKPTRFTCERVGWNCTTTVQSVLPSATWERDQSAPSGHNATWSSGASCGWLAHKLTRAPANN